MQICAFLHAQTEGNFGDGSGEEEPRKGKTLKAFVIELGWLRQTHSPWGDDDARSYESDTALRKSFAGNHKPNFKVQLDAKFHARQEEIELQAMEEFLQISILKKGNYNVS